MRRFSGPILRGVLAGGLLFVAGMTLVALLAVATGVVPSIDHDVTGAPGFLRWILLELALGLPLAALSGRVARSVGRSVRAPENLAAATLLLGSLEAVTLLSSGFVPTRSLTGVLVLLAPILASLSVYWGGRGNLAQSGFRGGAGPGTGYGVWRWGIPTIMILTGVAIGIFGIPVVEEPDRQRIVASALAIDLVFVIPLIVYALFVRPGRLPLVSVVPAAILGYGIATFSIPEGHDTVLTAIRWAIIPAEILLLSVVATRAHRLFRASANDGDLVQRFRESARIVLGNRIAADILTTELTVLYYALRLHSTESAGTPARQHSVFTVHRSPGYAAILGGLGMAILVETVAVHMLVRQASPISAWILTGLSCYALLWLVGDFRALRSRLTVVAGGSLRFRMGLRWELDVSLSDIDSAFRSSAAEASEDRNAFSGVLVGSPNVRIRLHKQCTILGMYGIRKRTAVLYLRIDDPDRFLDALGRPGTDPDDGMEVTPTRTA